PNQIHCRHSGGSCLSSLMVMLMCATAFHKDQSLDELARVINVAQFVSYAPGADMRQRYSRVIGFEPNEAFDDLPQAVAALMRRSPEGSLNVRSFREDDPRSNEFLYGLKHEDDVVAAVRR